MFGDIEAPQLVGALDGEVAVDEIGVGVGLRVTDGAAAASAPVEALHAGLSHQPRDALVVDRHAEAEHQFGVHAWPSVGAAGFGVTTFDVLDQQLVLLRPGRLHRGTPFVECLAAHAKNPAGHRDRVSVVGEFTDQREGYFGRTFSRVK